MSQYSKHVVKTRVFAAAAIQRILELRTIGFRGPDFSSITAHSESLLISIRFTIYASQDEREGAREVKWCTRVSGWSISVATATRDLSKIAASGPNNHSSREAAQNQPRDCPSREGLDLPTARWSHVSTDIVTPNNVDFLLRALLCNVWDSILK